VQVAVLYTSYNTSELFGEEYVFIELALWWESEASYSLFFTSVLPTDSGYYTCKMAFPYEGVTYEITRTIELQTVGKYCPLSTLKKMTLPCKVFAGPNSNIYTDVEWLANDTTIDVVYKQNRVMEGERQEITENGENFIVVPLIFKSVEQVDFYTDFKCLAQNRYGSQFNYLSWRETGCNCYTYSKSKLQLKYFMLSDLILGIQPPRAGKSHVYTKGLNCKFSSSIVFQYFPPTLINISQSTESIDLFLSEAVSPAERLICRHPF
uniref:Ig-like domain-containing protein n=1 Tax=Pavo cristatus TaxID=9049 RepID=A0A8C9ELU2_PAVCR